jgi:rhodanese-related sulfurtransferase
VSMIDVVAAHALISARSDALVVDVRTPGEYETAHIEGAINLPLDQIDAHPTRLADRADTPILLICQSGERASRCQQSLASAGLDGTLVLDGGMNAWLAVGHPVVRGRARWALDRQVRLAAGLLVAAGVAVSVWWPPARYLAGLIGIGLAAAAVTNTCALGMLLSRLPYNQRPIQIISTPRAATAERTGTGAGT